MLAFTSSSRPHRIALPRPWFWNASAARITLGSSPSAKTMRFFSPPSTVPEIFCRKPAAGSTRWARASR